MLRWSTTFLLLSLLFLSAALDSEERQRANEAPDLARANANAGRGPPKNVTVESVSETSLNVSWLPPDAKPKYFRIRWDAQEEETYDTFYVVSSMKPCTKYFFNVASVYENDTLEAPSAQGETGATVPPQPGQCTFSEIYNHDVKISWEEPDTSCRIKSYAAQWSWNTLWTDGQKSGDTNTTRPYFTVEDLPPYSNLTVRVAAASEAGQGQLRTCWYVTSSEEPGPPTLEEVVPLEGSALVTWSPPEEANGIIVEYEVHFQDEEGGSPGMESVAGTVLTTLVEDLVQCQSYNFTVRARTEPGWGPLSNALGAVVPGEVKNVSCDVFEGRLTVCWDIPPTKCPVTQYNVNWSGTVLWNDEALTGSDAVPWEGEEGCYVLQETEPYTDYTVCVVVDDYSNGSKCCSQDTPQGVPGPPVLDELEVDGRTLIVSWLEPLDKNGVIDGYNIAWQEGSAAGGVSQDVNRPPWLFTYEIRDLEPCHSYSVGVRAHTEGGWGNESDTKTAAIDNYVAESSLSCSSEEPRKVELSWSLGSPDCPVSQYLLLWNASVLWSNQNISNNNSVSIPRNASSFEVDDVEPYTLFVACLSVVGEQGTFCCTNVTQEEESSEPRELKVLYKTSSTASVNWTLPQHLNGALEGWRLNWSSANESIGGVDLEASELAYTIEELHPGTAYRIYLRAINGAGLGDSAETSVTTAEKGGSPETRVGEIVGASIGVLLLVAAALASAVCIYRRKKTLREHPPLVQVDKTMEGRNDHDTYSSDLYQRQQRRYWGERHSLDRQGDTAVVWREDLHRLRRDSRDSFKTGYEGFWMKADPRLNRLSMSVDNTSL